MVNAGKLSMNLQGALPFHCNLNRLFDSIPHSPKSEAIEGLWFLQPNKYKQKVEYLNLPLTGISSPVGYCATADSHHIQPKTRTETPS